jgi:membrane protein DedA with SNARE-associated domain
MTGGYAQAVIEWILSQPYVLAAAFLTGVACVRSQCTYWLGRAVRAGVVKAKWATKMSGEAALRATRRIEKYGWPIIPVSFLTVGFQSAVNLTAGLIGWRWRRYTLAASLGWVLWGCVYAAGGLAVFVGLAALARRSPWAAAAVGVTAVGLVVGIVKLVKRTRAARGADEAEADVEGQAAEAQVAEAQVAA